MKKCLNCDSIFEDDNLNFCSNCGGKLTYCFDEKNEKKDLKCSSCGCLLSPRFKYCIRCGRNVITGKKVDSEEEYSNKNFKEIETKEKPKGIINGFILMIFVIGIAVVFTHLLQTIDVKNVGVNDTSLGLSTINLFVNDALKNKEMFYKFSKYLGFVPFGFVALFAIIGVVQLIKNKSLKKVDYGIIMLIVPYALMVLVYFYFEKNVINYRPVLEESGVLEASFPSSHTLFSVVLCGSACSIFERLHKKEIMFKSGFSYNMMVFLSGILAFAIVLSRALSGVHWITDIVGGLLYGFAILSVYSFLLRFKTIEK